LAAAFATNHTVGEGVIELERRANRERKLAYPHRVAITHLHDRQIFCVDLNDGDIGLFIGAHDPGWKIAAISQSHFDFIGAFHHVKVRQDKTIWSNDEAGAFALDRVKPPRASPGSIFVGWPLKEEVVQSRLFSRLAFL